MTVQRGNRGRSNVRHSARSLRLVSRGDGGVLVRVCAPRPPPIFLFLPFHAPVLKPDLDVSLGEAQGQRQLHAAWPRDVAVKQELLLQLQQLGPRVGGPRAFVFLSLRHHIWSCRDRQFSFRNLINFTHIIIKLVIFFTMRHA